MDQNSDNFKSYFQKHFTIKFEKPTLDTNDHEVMFYVSEEYTVGGLPWKVILFSEKSEETNHVAYLGAYIQCVKLNAPWKCKAVGIFNFYGINAKTESYDFEYNKVVNAWGFQALCEWARISKQGELTIDITIQVNPKGLIGDDPTKVFKKFERFLHPQQGNYNQVLVVGGSKVYVIKELLSECSIFFNKLFNADFIDKSLAEIPMSDVCLLEFLVLLDQIYPSWNSPISDDVLEPLMCLADRYLMGGLFEACEKQVMQTNGLSISKKLILADKFGLTGVRASIIGKIETIEKLKELGSSEEVKLFNAETKSALWDKFTEFV